MKKKTLFLTRTALIAALYVAVTCICESVGLASHAVQFRLSEALCVLPVYTSAAVPGVTIGCLLFNLFYTGNILDIVFGTLATLIGAVFARLLKNHPYIAGLPTVISNTVIIPFVIALGTSEGNLASVPFFMLTIFIGEAVSCWLLGTLLLVSLKKYKKYLFDDN